MPIRLDPPRRSHRRPLSYFTRLQHSLFSSTDILGIINRSLAVITYVQPPKGIGPRCSASGPLPATGEKEQPGNDDYRPEQRDIRNVKLPSRRCVPESDRSLVFATRAPPLSLSAAMICR